MVRALPCHGRGCGFEPRRVRHVPVALRGSGTWQATYHFNSNSGDLVHGPPLRCGIVGDFMHYTYVLRSRKDGKCYIGSTSDLRRRIAEHERGEVPSTAPRRPFNLIFYEAFLHQEEAVGREKYFKTTKRKIALRKMLTKTLNSETSA